MNSEFGGPHGGNEWEYYFTKNKRNECVFPFYHPQVYDKKPSFIVFLFVLSQEEKLLPNLRILIFTRITRCHWESITLLESFYFLFFNLSTTASHIS